MQFWQNWHFSRKWNTILHVFIKILYQKRILLIKLKKTKVKYVHWFLQVCKKSCTCTFNCFVTLAPVLCAILGFFKIWTTKLFCMFIYTTKWIFFIKLKRTQGLLCKSSLTSLQRKLYVCIGLSWIDENVLWLFCTYLVNKLNTVF